jgi:exopolyphosphatase/guanosine-5'-triphosphate,3'-diphosphate pyrophosphatase
MREQGGRETGTAVVLRTFAAIYLGTNNCRLLVARVSLVGFDVVDAYSRPVQLGEARR